MTKGIHVITLTLFIGEVRCYIQIYRKPSIKAYRLLIKLENKLGLF